MDGNRGSYSSSERSIWQLCRYTYFYPIPGNYSHTVNHTDVYSYSYFFAYAKCHADTNAYDNSKSITYAILCIATYGRGCN